MGVDAVNCLVRHEFCVGDGTSCLTTNWVAKDKSVSFSSPPYAKIFLNAIRLEHGDLCDGLSKLMDECIHERVHIFPRKKMRKTYHLHLSTLLRALCPI